MRLGIHCGDTHIAVAVHDRGAIRERSTMPARGTDPLLAAEVALSELGRQMHATHHSALVTSITFEVSEILRPTHTLPAHLIRISPRRPLHGADPFSIPWLTGTHTTTQPRIIHLEGGHNAQGQEIVPLKLSPLAAHHREVAAAPRFVVSAVGSLLNPSHELQSGATLIDQFPGAQVEYAHQFHHTSFAVRERTAFVNLALRERAEAIVTSFSVAASTHFPHARLFVATNSGGSIPLTRLAVTPVDSVASQRPTEAIGAAISAQAPEGPLTYRSGAEVFSCELSMGLPTVVPALLSEVFGKLATPASNIRTYRHPENGPFDSQASEPASDELAATGAALLPRVDWLMTLTQVANEPEMARAKQAAESRVHARLVATGTPPESIRTVESLVTATSYGNPGIIALRIRAIADPDLLPRSPRSRL